jgi:hypothetical protein
MAEAVYAIEDFPADELLWRIEWIGGVGYNANVPSDPLIDVCLAQLPVGETNQLSARSRSSQTKRTVRIGIGLLPYPSFRSFTLNSMFRKFLIADFEGLTRQRAAEGRVYRPRLFSESMIAGKMAQCF